MLVLRYLIVGVAVGIGVAADARAQLLSPGPLSKAHAELEGDQNCQRCHASGARVTEPGCLECHADIDGQRRRRVGLHGTEFRERSCAGCHIEHLGTDVSLIRWPGADPARFDHGRTGWKLRGAHAALACKDCHQRKNERGSHTYLGLASGCADCHEDPHERRFGTRCGDCHNELQFDQLDLGAFDHDLARFSLEGHHQQVACAACHGTPPQYEGLAFSDCGDCHEDPHRGRLQPACKQCHEAQDWNSLIMPRGLHPGLSLGGGHRGTECSSCHDAGVLAAPSAGDACVDCHAPVHEAPFGNRCGRCHGAIRWLGLPSVLGRRLHRLTAFPLRGSHGKVACADCHSPSLPQAVRYRGLDHARCGDCHRDAHRGTLQEHGDCSLCHDPIGFAPSLVSVDVHGQFAFALEGAHAATACGACHAFTAPRRLDWTRADATCQECHANPHGTQFAAEIAAGGCAHCHAPAGWGVSDFAHPAWPLTGAHRRASCDACHEPTAADRAAGQGTSYRGAPRDCEGCHDDVHAGQFRLTRPVRACGYCHTTGQFSLLTFAHDSLTSYRLEGKHRQTECADCHPSVHLRNGEEVVHYRLGYHRCADCHADPHTVPESFR